jgi:WD40 repeat protein
MSSTSTILPYLVTDLSAPPPFVERTFGEPLFHTDSDVAALQYAADGSLWSVEESGILRQWGPEGKLLNRLFLSDLETLWAFNADATLLASGSDDLTVWDTGSGKPLGRIAPGSWTTSLAFAPAGDLLFSGHDDGTVRIWNARTLQPAGAIPAHPLPISALAIRKNAPELATAGEDRLIRIWDLKSGQCAQTLAGHTDRIPALAWQPAGDMLISAGWDTTARVWAPPSPDPVILLNSHSEQVYALAFSRDGRLLACSDSDDTIHVWDDPRKGKTLFILRGHEEEIRCLAFSPDGKRLASAGADHVVHVWDTENGKLVAGPNPEAPHRIALSEAGNRAVLYSNAGSSVHAWDVNNGASVHAPASPDHVISVAASPDGKLIAASGRSAEVRVWNADSRELVATLPHTRGPISGLKFAPDSRTLAAASLSDGLIWLWRIGEPEAILVIPEAAESSTLEGLDFHPNGKWLAVGGFDWLGTGGSDGSVCIWDLETRDRLATFEAGVTSVAFDPTGRFLAAGALRQNVLVWDMEKQRLVFTLAGHQDRIGALAFSPDGNWLVSGSDDATVRVWNVLTGQLAIARQFDVPVHSIGFSHDGNYLYSGNGNSTCFRLALKRLLED